MFVAALAIAVVAIYLYKLDGVGVLGPDEPRYAAIGREMAASGDYITPVLWGKPWFEKPPLLYWITALGTSLGFGPDLCGRLPLVFISLLFLAGMLFWTSKEFGQRVAFVATGALATSAGWLTYSSFCLTDLPLAVAFSVAVFTACSLLGRPGTPKVALLYLILGVSIGLGVLAKGLVPIALSLPLFWFLRKQVRYWWLAIVSCLAVSFPWYLLVYLRNGYPFIEDFFIKHHLERLYSSSLQHTQPPYYYVPVLLAGLFPWTPLFGLLFLKPRLWDERRQLLLSVALFGFVFFSVTRNKLPHYLLPVLPSLFVLLGSYFQDRRISQLSRYWFLASALFIAAVPWVAGMLPPILAAGRLVRIASGPLTAAAIALIVLPVAFVLLAPRKWIAAGLTVCFLIAMAYLKTVSYPVIDASVSPRSFWIANIAHLQSVCNGGTNRDWLYGLSYYRGADFQECQTGHFDYVLKTVSRGAPELKKLP